MAPNGPPHPPWHPGAPGTLLGSRHAAKEAIKRRFILSYISIQHIRLLLQRQPHWGEKRSRFFRVSAPNTFDVF